jgi:hypothetical protein
VLFTAAPGGVDVLVEFSQDGGASWLAALAGSGSTFSSPVSGLSEGMERFEWDSVASGAAIVTGALLRVSLSEPATMSMTSCVTPPFDIDNVNAPPVCTLTASETPVTRVVALDFELVSSSGPWADVLFECSTDCGDTFLPLTPAATSPLSNPEPAFAPGAAVFEWDTAADGVGLLAIDRDVLVRAVATDGVSSRQGLCLAMPVAVDNTALCQSDCGDCDRNGAVSTILDALAAAQISVTAIPAPPLQGECCDVNASGSIDILDALLMAQSSAGIPVSLACPQP